MKKKYILFITIVVVILILGICFTIFINNYYNKKASEQEVISNDMLYNTANMQLVSDYNTFYTLEKIIKKIITNIQQENYKSVMGNISENYLERESEKEITEKLKEITKILNDIEYKNTEYSKLLYRVYEKETNIYNCLLNINGDIYYVLISLDSQNNKFAICNLMLAEEENEE